MVDYTAPVVQLHALRQTTLLAQRVLQIRWTAIDAHLVARPVEIAYRRPPAMEWLPVTIDPLANTGRYDWRLPEDLLGRLAVRITVSDQGTHRVESNEQTIELTEISPAYGGSEPASRGESEVWEVPATGPGSARAKARAAGLFADARAMRERGDYRAAIARLREAARLAPRRSETFAEMAGILYILGDFDSALDAYEIALQQRPSMRKALQGIARVYRQRQDYNSAARHLRTILRYNPHDAEVWMNLGDIAIYQGDEILARDCYRRAAETDPQQKEITEAARKRLALMQEVSRSYRPAGQ